MTQTGVGAWPILRKNIGSHAACAAMVRRKHGRTFWKNVGRQLSGELPTSRVPGRLVKTRAPRSNQSLEDIARTVNPVIRGWVNYYGAYQRSTLLRVLHHIDYQLVKWVKWKYKKKGNYSKRAIRWIGPVALTSPLCLRIGHLVCLSRLNDGSRMNGDVHVRFCESLGL